MARGQRETVAIQVVTAAAGRLRIRFPCAAAEQSLQLTSELWKRRLRRRMLLIRLQLNFGVRQPTSLFLRICRVIPFAPNYSELYLRYVSPRIHANPQWSFQGRDQRMQDPDALHWARWAFFAWSVMATLELWGKVDADQLPAFQRVLSLCLFAFALPFWLFMLWRAYGAFGGGYAIKAFFVSWLGMLALDMIVYGGYGMILSFVVKDPDVRRTYRAKLRYAYFAPKLILALAASYLLLSAIP